MLVVTGEFERAYPLVLELHVLTRDTEDVPCMCAADHFLSDCAMDRRTSRPLRAIMQAR
jgi:hypothetical protein